VRHLLYAACFLEAGLLLVVLPWTVFWDRNYLFDAVRLIHAAVQSPYVRGAVSGLGLLNVGIGIAEVGSLIASRLDTAREPDLAPPSDLV
jgi:hypothetical protein